MSYNSIEFWDRLLDDGPLYEGNHVSSLNREKIQRKLQRLQ